uniref:Uncharacterized protein n=1 Tax=Anguilla anguilla TaxID=7936 RepID=A0A0E9Q6L8_ANGAN
MVSEPQDETEEARKRRIGPGPVFNKRTRRQFRPLYFFISWGISQFGNHMSSESGPTSGYKLYD